MVDLDTVKIRQPLIPIVGVLLHDPDFLVNAAHMPEGTSAGEVGDITQVVLVLLKRFLAHDDVPTAGKGPEHERRWAEFAEVERDGVGIDNPDLIHRRKEWRAGHADSFWGPDDTREGRMHIFGGEVGAIVEFYSLA